MSHITRRHALFGIGLLPLVGTAATAQVTASTFDVKLRSGRILQVTRWDAPKPTGYILFSHGGNSWPTQYDKLAQVLVGAGYTVLAPLHTDSLKIADAERADLKKAFGDRIEDMAHLGGYAAATANGLPLIAIGHSYGSLFALMLGGALTYVAPVRNAAVKAVVCFSSPGNIPGLINPAAYTSLEVPLLMVTGDKDVVPGFTADWHDHLLPFEGTPVKGSYALIVKEGTHQLIGGQTSAEFGLVTDVTVDFVRAVTLNKETVPMKLSANGAEKAELRHK
ncbi:alpha/beta hydrolase [Asticcacaulis sp. BYS171W]|uniref:Alpha/beta hydrolase n=1 Tax=Asticcacaulis aquaticus TaxID=2984212 RepID=A0ABT5HXT3_9CAUL|nr:alpha/beta hydrolase [Asticcacaulis aquaticus]MDC7684881.1 alpha/beta hydrolase [Asticcacaulis aquaticus]